MAMPILRSLLPHSAVQKYGTPSEDGWSNKTLPSSRNLAHVRFEPTSRLLISKDNKQIQLSAIMFFDCRNSEPAGTTFAIGDQIVRGSTTYMVVGGIDPVYDAKNPHHWEVELQ